MTGLTSPETPIKVVVWGENRHEQVEQKVRDLYPNGMHNTIKEGIEENLGSGVGQHRDP